MSSCRLPILLCCIISIFSIASFTSCVNTKKSVYFVDQQDSTFHTELRIPESKIQQNDLLSISVTSLNAEASQLFNSPNISFANNSTNTGVSVQSSGYLVNREGTIQFPILGTIKASGLTVSELRSRIEKSLTDKKLLIDPIVNIRYLNFKVTVLGEVANPTVIQVPNEKITLLEALGLAGDITIYGKRDNIMIIRETEGTKIIKRLNLNSTDLFTSPYYYLLSNDIVYVEPNKAKVASSGRSAQLLPIILSGLSFVAIIIDRITRK